MNKAEAKEILFNALQSYCEDCIGSDEYEEERKELDEAWKIVSND